MSEPIIRVTAVDSEADRETCEAEVKEIAAGGYVITCAEPAYVAGERVFANGTRVVTIKLRQPPLVPPAGAEDDDDPDGCCGHHGLICHISEPCCRRCPGEDAGL